MRKAKSKKVESKKFNWKKYAPPAIALACAALICIFLFSGGKKTIYVPEQVVVDSDITMEFVYNAVGHLTQVRPEGAADALLDISCDAKGNVTKTTQKAGNRTTVKHYTYSSQGNLLSCTTELDGTVTEVLKWEYNTRNQVTFFSKETFSGGTSTLYKTLYAYDDSYKLENSRTYLGEEELYHTTYTYDAKGRLSIEELRDSKRDKVLVFIDYTFDEYGNTVAQIDRYIAGERVCHTDYYDTCGNMIRREFGGDTPTMTFEYTYKAIKVSKNSHRQPFTPFESMPKTGLANSLF